MWIDGYVHETYDDAFLAHVEVVNEYVAKHRCGKHVGYMELTDGTDLKVFKHIAGGTYYGYSKRG